MTSDAGLPPAPRFDIVLRGFDRRQVLEHVERLQRVIDRMRFDLDQARAGGPPRPSPHPRAAAAAAELEGEPDAIGNFTDRMQNILQSAEEEAAEIRARAYAEAEGVRSQLGDLIRQRDTMLSELTRMRSQLEGVLSAPTSAMPARIPGYTPPAPRPYEPPPTFRPSPYGPLSPSGSYPAVQPERPPVRNGAPPPGVAGPPRGPAPHEPGEQPRPAEPTVVHGERPGGPAREPGKPAHRLPSGVYPAVPPAPAGPQPSHGAGEQRPVEQRPGEQRPVEQRPEQRPAAQQPAERRPAPPTGPQRPHQSPQPAPPAAAAAGQPGVRPGDATVLAFAPGAPSDAGHDAHAPRADEAEKE